MPIQAPTLKVKAQTDTPLLISSPRLLSWDGREGEFAFELVNVSGKSIRAYAIKQEEEAGGSQASGVLFSNLDLTSSPALQPNQSQTIADTCEAISDKEQSITLSVDYAEFSDGTKWGSDTGMSAERSAGQRAAAIFISKRLAKIQSESNANEVMKVIEATSDTLEPPVDHSEEWKAGFRSAYKLITARLKNAQKQGGANQVQQKLRQLSETFKGVN